MPIEIGDGPEEIVKATRINISNITKLAASIVLPEDVTLFCPNCGEKANDKGQCSIRLASLPNDEFKTGFELAIIADCRKCDYHGRGAATNFFI